ncbi:MAG: transporter [Treponema sp. GWB1_62_6]|nr:MAG: transporter [Treponema sp. GWA1_62_8]OHE67837.1 MAG: transporter [Treponema sp. GWC1_61_84]OHE71933.1 MAG: transporter [Treponema sp. GWB1_62_6]OHE76292.1 MAG: transporter [Treponema sp. RIFOXYC1_FULL_61_9]
MFQGLQLFAEAIGGLLTFRTVFDVLWATQLGIIVGMLPGLTATMGIALMTTLTFKMAANNAILILICMYIGAIYGGSRSAILLNIPGTPANAATCMDGYPLAQQGKAGQAIGIATTGSFLGSVIGMFAMALFTPLLGTFALKFRSFEFFWFSVFGVVICGNLTAPKDPLKGWIAGFLGLFVAMIGMEGIHAYSRFSFGSTDLSGGIALLPAMVGAFGFAEIITVMRNPRMQVVQTKIDHVVPRLKDILPYWKTIIRSGIVGTIIGVLPGVGEDIASWVSYDMAKRSSKHPEEFGKGSVDGLIAAETGNNACVPGAIIPVLTLAIPGSAPAAVLLGAMLIHGIRPGPLIMIEFPKFIYETTAMVLFATIAMFVLGLSLVRTLVKVLLVPRQKLMPIVFVLCVVGAYAITGRMFDVGVMVVFGVIGFVLREMEYPMAPLVLGIILGDILDKNLRRSLILTDGRIGPLFTRPISFFIFALTVLIILSKVKFAQDAANAAKRAAAGLFRRKGAGDGV